MKHETYLMRDFQVGVSEFPLEEVEEYIAGLGDGHRSPEFDGRRETQRVLREIKLLKNWQQKVIKMKRTASH